MIRTGSFVVRSFLDGWHTSTRPFTPAIATFTVTGFTSKFTTTHALPTSTSPVEDRVTHEFSAALTVGPVLIHQTSVEEHFLVPLADAD